MGIRFCRCCLLAIVATSFLCAEISFGQEFNVALMNSTFELGGPGIAPGTQSFGTVFVLGKPIPGAANGKAYLVLITAAHVLNDISGDFATIVLRKKNDDGTYVRNPQKLRIRNGGKNLFFTNPNADVAAMYVNFPPGTMEGSLISTNLLTDDDVLKTYELHPGDELLCLGFPLAINLDGFPVVRTGLLASYPLTPSRVVQKFFYTFHIFPGNSGGPVYFNFQGREYGHSTHLGEDIHGILGLISEQQKSILPEYKDADLDIAVVVPSAFIKDTIAMLPSTPID